MVTGPVPTISWPLCHPVPHPSLSWRVYAADAINARLDEGDAARHIRDDEDALAADAASLLKSLDGTWGLAASSPPGEQVMVRVVLTITLIVHRV